MEGVVTNLEHLKDWFFQVNYPLWKLYRGDIKHRELIIETSDKNLSVDDSWDMLEKMLNMHGRTGGKFCVFVPSNGRGHGVKAYFSFYGDPYAQFGNMPAGVHGIQGMQAGPDTIKEEIAKARQQWELERKIDDLEAQIGAKESLWDRLLDRITEDPDTNTKIVEICGNLLGNLVSSAAPAQVGVSGFSDQPPAGPTTGPNPDNDEEYLYDQNRILSALDRIRESVPEMEIHDLLEALADYLEANPAMKGFLISNLKKKENG